MTQQHASLAAQTIDQLVAAAERLEKAEAKLDQIRTLAEEWARPVMFGDDVTAMRTLDGRQVLAILNRES